MAIVKGFPPSNTISPGISIGNSYAVAETIIVEKSAKLSQLKIEDKFKTQIIGESNFEFMVVSKAENFDKNLGITVRAICYKKPENIDGIQPGEICNFTEDETVTWLQETTDGVGIEPNCCRGCGAKLINDNISKKYGDYCPNSWCEVYK